MTLEVTQHITQRHPAVIDDLKNAVVQEAAKAYLTRITTVKSLELEPGDKLCDNSWMEYIDEDCMTDASNHSYSTPSSPSRKIEVPLLHVTNSQTEADPCRPAPSPSNHQYVSLWKCTTLWNQRKIITGTRGGH